MYSKILKELRKSQTLKEAYTVLKGYKRQYDLTFNQCRYLIYQYNEKG